MSLLRRRPAKRAINIVHSSTLQIPLDRLGPRMLILVLVLVLKDALRTIFEVLVLVLESQVLVLILVLVV